jgi:hypothetical protein
VQRVGDQLIHHARRARQRRRRYVHLQSLSAERVRLVVRVESSCQTPADLEGQVVAAGTADDAEVGFTGAILNDLGMVEGQDC